jgi:Uma2 family endonuclease
MTIDAKKRKKRSGDRGRFPYRFTATQVLKMIESGIIVEDVELWDGVIYKMVKGELHNYIVSQAADVLRAVIPEGYHIREEKSCKHAETSLPEPDVAVARGRKADYLPDPPPLACMALVIEVDHHTGRADAVEKFGRYAEVGIPAYWHVVVKAREVRVYESPHGRGPLARYGKLSTYQAGHDFAIIIDGQEVGRVAVADLFPPERTP